MFCLYEHSQCYNYCRQRHLSQTKWNEERYHKHFFCVDEGYPWQVEGDEGWTGQPHQRVVGEDQGKGKGLLEEGSRTLGRG